MPIIDLNEAINEIKNILDDVENSPFFLMVGAGVSIPNIPSAQSIIEICRKKLNITKKDTINYACEYSEILSKAFPSPELRRRFLESIIVNTKITDSNVELADILLSKKLTNTLFTTNFDNQIERAISLLGGDNIITSDNKVIEFLNSEINIPGRLDTLIDRERKIIIDFAHTPDGVEKILKPDLYVPGCPPHPATLLEGILRLMDKKL